MTQRRPAPGYEGRYEITRDGRVWSLLSDQWMKIHMRGRYPAVPMMDASSKERMVSVHRLVALAFVPNPENKPHVNHIDGDRWNAGADNLEWVTVSENHKHAFKIGARTNRTPAQLAAYGKSVLRANAAWRALSADQVTEMRRLYSAGMRQCEIARKFNYHTGGLSRLLSGKSYKGVGA